MSNINVNLRDFRFSYFDGCGKNMEQPIDKADSVVYYNVKNCHNLATIRKNVGKWRWM